MENAKLTLSPEDREIVFGCSKGRSLVECAKQSDRVFVRSQDHLAFDSPDATGQRLTAYETLLNFGERRIAEILDYGSAILVSNPTGQPSEQPGQRIREWRETLGISRPDLARRTGVSAKDISNLETGSSRIPAKSFAKLCSALSLNEYQVGFEEISEKDRDRGYRFKQLQRDREHPGRQLSKPSTFSLLEDAWLISKQNDLKNVLGKKSRFQDAFEPDPDYGSRSAPAWKIGYELASRTREILGISPHKPIENLRSLVEEELQIPLIQDELSSKIVGATVQSGEDRGIVINIKARNFNTWSSRLTIAHELGHLLWDPDQMLETLIVDQNEVLSRAPWSTTNSPVEQRANAFAIEFLAPQDVIKNRFSWHTHPPDDIYDYMVEFGVSFTAAKYHMWNATHQIWKLKEIKSRAVKALEEWEGREGFLTTYLPSRELEDAGFRMNRRGRFLSYVVDAKRDRLISEDTAALYLGIDGSMLHEVEEIRDEFF